MEGAQRIFVVLRDNVIARTLAILLKQQEHDVDVYLNPQDALLDAGVKRPSMVITDISMDLILGLELGVKFVSMLPHCTILCFSGLSHCPTLGDNFPLSNWRFLQRPIHPAMLLEQIRRTSTGNGRAYSEEVPAVYSPANINQRNDLTWQSSR